jgi:hypothetical protein
MLHEWLESSRQSLATRNSQRRGGGCCRDQRSRFRPALEGLEVRIAPAVFTVIGTADGPGTITSTGPDTFDATTLRAAVIAADAHRSLLVAPAARSVTAAR